MAAAIWSRDATADLDGIWDFIALKNPSAANRLVRTINAKCDLLATHPEMGELRPELAEGLRSFSEGNYVIFFRALPDGIEVARVLHGARNIKSLF